MPFRYALAINNYEYNNWVVVVKTLCMKNRDKIWPSREKRGNLMNAAVVENSRNLLICRRLCAYCQL